MLGIVIPAYNEFAIDVSVKKIREVFPESKILVVVDGGSIETANKASLAGAEVLYRSLNKGKGYSVREGILELLKDGCDPVMFTDADLACPPEEWTKLIQALKHADVAIASRKINGAKAVYGSPLRKIASDVFASYAKLATGMRFKDFQCGCKAFRRQAAYQLFFKDLISERFCFDIEILLRAYHLLAICEIPVIWTAGKKSSVSLIKDSFQMALDVLKIKHAFAQSRSFAVEVLSCSK